MGTRHGEGLKVFETKVLRTWMDSADFLDVSHQKPQSGRAGFGKTEPNGSSRIEGPPIRAPLSLSATCRPAHRCWRAVTSSKQSQNAQF